jgi:CHASE1-domain containing sensor protein
LSLSAWFTVSLREDRLAALELNARADDYALILQNGIDEYLNKVVALRALYDANDFVSRDEFEKFSQGILRGQTAILAVSWTPRVTQAERHAHELAAVRDGLPGYQIKSIAADGRLVAAADRSEYFPILYVFYSTALSGAPLSMALISTTEVYDSRRSNVRGTAVGWPRVPILRCASEKEIATASSS